MRKVFLTDMFAIRMILGGVVLGIGWSVIYSLTLTTSDLSVSLFHAVIYGVMLGFFSGSINVVAFIMITNAKTYTSVSTKLSTGMMSVVFVIVFLFFSPTFIHHLLSVVVLTIADYYLTKYALGEFSTT